MAKKFRAGTDEWWQLKIESGVIAARPGNLKCMFCATSLDKGNFCNKCWNERL